MFEQPLADILPPAYCTMNWSWFGHASIFLPIINVQYTVLVFCKLPQHCVYLWFLLHHKFWNIHMSFNKTWFATRLACCWLSDWPWQICENLSVTSLLYKLKWWRRIWNAWSCLTQNRSKTLGHAMIIHLGPHLQLLDGLHIGRRRWLAGGLRRSLSLQKQCNLWI